MSQIELNTLGHLAEASIGFALLKTENSIANIIGLVMFVDALAFSPLANTVLRLFTHASPENGQELRESREQ